MQLGIDTALKDKRLYEQKLTEYYQAMLSKASVEQRDKFAEFRKFSVDTVKECGIFYIGNMVEMLVPRFFDEVESFGVISATNKKPIFNDRWVIPIKTVTGDVQNFVGYSPNADERYIYGTARYYRRRETMWGLENLNLAYDLGYAFLTEGITDAIRLRDLGYKNAFAMCGTHNSDYIMNQLNRCRHGIIRIPDRDDAGLRACKHWKCNRSITVYISFMYKDLDEMCREQENQNLVKEYMDACIEWIKSDEHRGNKLPCKEVTIL